MKRIHGHLQSIGLLGEKKCGARFKVLINGNVERRILRNLGETKPVRETYEAVQSAEVPVEFGQHEFIPERGRGANEIARPPEPRGEIRMATVMQGRFGKLRVKNRQFVHIIVRRHLAEQIRGGERVPDYSLLLVAAGVIIMCNLTVTPVGRTNVSLDSLERLPG